MFELDTRDGDMIARHMLALNATPLDRPRVGDWVRFADGVERRIGYMWRDENGADLPHGVQTSAGGSYYLGDGYVSMSGSLFTGIGAETLAFTGEQKGGRVWVFHHDLAGAGRGVDTVRPFRVYSCTLQSSETR